MKKIEIILLNFYAEFIQQKWESRAVLGAANATSPVGTAAPEAPTLPLQGWHRSNRQPMSFGSHSWWQNNLPKNT